jgi:phenylalanyl-tRNA synthetase alpha subunit
LEEILMFDEQVAAMRQEALEAIASAANTGSLEELRVRYLGKKGGLTELLRGMAQASPEERPKMGKSLMWYGMRYRTRLHPESLNSGRKNWTPVSRQKALTSACQVGFHRLAMSIP